MLVVHKACLALPGARSLAWHAPLFPSLFLYLSLLPLPFSPSLSPSLSLSLPLSLPLSPSISLPLSPSLSLYLSLPLSFISSTDLSCARQISVGVLRRACREPPRTTVSGKCTEFRGVLPAPLKSLALKQRSVFVVEDSSRLGHGHRFSYDTKNRRILRKLAL